MSHSKNNLLENMTASEAAKRKGKDVFSRFQLMKHLGVSDNFALVISSRGDYVDYLLKVLSFLATPNEAAKIFITFTLPEWEKRKSAPYSKGDLDSFMYYIIGTKPSSNTAKKVHDSMLEKGCFDSSLGNSKN